MPPPHETVHGGQAPQSDQAQSTQKLLHLWSSKPKAAHPYTHTRTHAHGEMALNPVGPSASATTYSSRCYLSSCQKPQVSQHTSLSKIAFQVCGLAWLPFELSN